MLSFLGCDNGTTGNIGVIAPSETLYFPMPVKKELNYTKQKQFLHRVDVEKLFGWMKALKETNSEGCFCLVERPMINPQRWKPSMSAIRCLEATLIVLELLKIPFQYIDSKQWQKELLPKGLKKDELKKASLDIGKRLFPQIDWTKFKDADGLLIAEWGQRKGWGMEHLKYEGDLEISSYPRFVEGELEKKNG